MVTVDSPLVGPPTGTLSAALDYAGSANAEYIREVWRVAALVGLDPAIMVAQSAHETADWTSHWWTTRYNPAGIGITGDPVQDAASQTWANQTDAARGHVVHMCSYVYGALVHPWQSWRTMNHPIAGVPTFDIRDYSHLDQRLFDAHDYSWAGAIRTIRDLTGKWATDGQYAEKITRKHRAIFGAGEETVTKPHILVNAGHRNATGGNDIEREMTDDLARAYRDTFRAAGYVCDWLQEIDGDADPDDTLAGLDMVSRKMAAWIASQSGQCVLFDLHFEGTAPSVRGCFAIIPDVAGLTTGAPVPQDPADTWANNALDRRVGQALIDNLMLSTGIPPRTGIRQPGLMDESETGVGGQGYRLATFAYTSPQRTKAVRLVVEHGAHTNPQDLAIIRSPGFADKCAASALAAVNEAYNVAPPQPTAAPIWWAPGAVGIQKREADGAIAIAMLGEVAALKGASLYASVGGVKIGSVPAGTKLKIVGTHRAANGVRWAFVERDGGYPRMRYSSLAPKFPTL